MQQQEPLVGRVVVVVLPVVAVLVVVVVVVLPRAQQPGTHPQLQEHQQTSNTNSNNSDNNTNNTLVTQLKLACMAAACCSIEKNSRVGRPGWWRRYQEWRAVGGPRFLRWILAKVMQHAENPGGRRSCNLA
eukprot:422042-Amphidinium_carterae.1